ncbi:hypothetical protein [Parasitella parasitica]|uniref:WRKY domain-containing protein n=1 Tax=Parasitella parasitica TaxID=35722 RepID=A0A0B7NI01_9FUNG|nr:hypothetical protein [Parasitella parasitica]
MSDFNYTLTKDAAKAVPLYHHEQVPFHSFSRSMSVNSNSTSNVNLMAATTPPLANTIKQEQHQNPISGDLQDIIYSYQSQPELLRLILLSKLEEDKRRAEEAKLRAKELDLLLAQQTQQQLPNGNGHDSSMTFANSNNTNINASYQSQAYNNNSFTMQPTPPMSTNSSTDGRMYHHMRRTSLDAILASPTHCASTPLLQQQQQPNHHRRDSTIGSSFTGSADSDEFDDRTFSPIPTSATNTATTTPVSASSLLQMESYGSAATAAVVMSSLQNNNSNKLSPDYHLDDGSFTNSLQHHNQHQLDNRPLLNANVSVKYDFPSRPRRRREMQAITKIVETKEYPYVDGYFWKNNGNTVQKKTGNKSVYYKCSNSNKGCPVNKTVTWKDHGEYLIKYRGEHLVDCNKVQRIVDV